MEQPQPAVVVVGSVNVDMIVQSDRLPKPGETVTGGRFLTAGGGKGANQAIAARRLGADVRLVARVGHDGPGELVLRGFAAEHMVTTWIEVDADSTTGIALILVDRDGQNMIGVASGANARMTAADVRRAETAFVDAGVLLVQLEIPPDAVAQALELGRARGLTTILNPAPARPVPDDVLGFVDWLTPNEFEAATLSDRSVIDVDTALMAARALHERGAGNVVVTLGSRGAVFVSRRGEMVVPPFPVRAVDTTAAGDAFSAGLAVGIARGMPTVDVLRYASAAGALTTTRPGAQPSLPMAADVRDFLDGNTGGIVSVGRGE